jgi:hypothetical protein
MEFPRIAESALENAQDLINTMLNCKKNISHLSKSEKRLLLASIENAIDLCLEKKATAMNVAPDDDARQDISDMWFAPLQTLEQIKSELLSC